VKEAVNENVPVELVKFLELDSFEPYSVLIELASLLKKIKKMHPTVFAATERAVADLLRL